MELELLTTEKAAKYLGLAAGTLSNWRSTKKCHIPHITIGGTVKYNKTDLDKYIKDHTSKE